MVEVLMALAIVGTALVPIGWYFVSSGRQQAAIKAEAVAVGYAGKLMNELLDKVPFDEVVSGVPLGEGGSSATLDGVDLEWTVTVGDTMPSDISFTWEVLTEDASLAPGATAYQLDAKFRDLPALKDILLELRWKGPRDTEMGTPKRTQTLVTRRARL